MQKHAAFFSVFASFAIFVTFCGAPGAVAMPRTAAQVADPGRAVPMCTGDQLSVATDSENGSFDGMSHSGTLLVVRNLGPQACRIDPFPSITLRGASGALPVTFSVAGAKFMHPGPVVFPVIVPAGAEVTSSLRWVSGEVYDQSVCVSPTTLTLTVASKPLSTPLSASICGEKGKAISAEMTRFMTDPVYVPGKGK